VDPAGILKPAGKAMALLAKALEKEALPTVVG
jgi:hypothetical protein